MIDRTIGLIALLGSGETLPSSGKTHEYIAKNLRENPRIAILETPAGFELNSDRVAGKIKDFLEVRLQNYNPQIFQIPARKKGTEHSPDSMELVKPLLQANEILLGPGSPTYAVRQLQDSLAYEMIQARFQRGTALVLSSAATLAFSRFTIPVYEIYKVGEDEHWKDGLDFFNFLGISLSLVPHWNNQDGGDEVDTSRCYIGKPRFEMLLEKLPPDAVILGIDDHTSVILDIPEGICRVMGNGEVHILKQGETLEFSSGEQFNLSLLGEVTISESGTGIDKQVWKMAVEAEEEAARERETAPAPPEEVVALLEERESARSAKEWNLADDLRDKIEEMGWQVMDTPNGSELVPLES